MIFTDEEMGNRLAAMAMTGISVNTPNGIQMSQIAREAVQLADALITELEELK